MRANPLRSVLTALTTVALLTATAPVGAETAGWIGQFYGSFAADGFGVDETANAMALLPSGNIFVGGQTTGRVVDSETEHESAAAYTYVYDASGTAIRVMHYDLAPGSAETAAITDVVATGGGIAAAANVSDGVTSKAQVLFLDTDGAILDVGTPVVAPAGETVTAAALSVLSDGDLLLIGSITDEGEHDAFAARYDDAGDEVWFEQYVTASDQRFNDIVVTPSGAVFVAGTSHAWPGLTSLGDADGLVLRMDPEDGTDIWAAHSGTDAADAFNAIGFGGNRLVLTGTRGGDLVVAKWLPGGTRDWLRSAAADGFTTGTGIAVDSSGTISVAATTDQALAGATNSGGSDLALLTVPADGSRFTAALIGTPNTDTAGDVALLGDGTPVIAGTTDAGTAEDPVVLEPGGDSNGGDDGLLVTDPAELRTTATAYFSEITAPSKPRDLLLTPALRGLTVTWDIPALDGGLAVTSYEVTLTPGGATCATVPRSCSFTNLTGGTRYTASVVAVNEFGSSAAAQIRGYALASATAGNSARIGRVATVLRDVAGPITDRPIALQASAPDVNDGAWSTLVTKRTNTDGKAVVGFTPRRLVRLRWRFAGDATHTAATSRIQTLDVSKLAIGRTAGDPTVIRGRLTSWTGAGLAQRRVVLQSRPCGGCAWTQAGTTTSNSTGVLRAAAPSTSGMDVRWKWAGATKIRGSLSPVSQWP